MNPKIFSTNLSDLIYTRKPGVKVKQISTHSKKIYKGHHHKDFVKIPPQSEYKFPKIKDGPGIINCIWFSFFPLKALQFLRYLRIDGLQSLRFKIFFDNERKPRVNTPIGDFFGASWGYYRPNQARSYYVGMSSGGYYSYFPMPFKKSAQVVIQNTSRKKKCRSFYGQISYQTIPRFSDQMLYFNAKYQTLETLRKIGATNKHTTFRKRL